MEWEYNVTQLYAPLSSKDLTVFGKDGWELVTMFERKTDVNNKNAFACVFKRTNMKIVIPKVKK